MELIAAQHRSIALGRMHRERCIPFTARADGACWRLTWLAAALQHGRVMRLLQLYLAHVCMHMLIPSYH
jgi:hypothetical protein